MWPHTTHTTAMTADLLNEYRVRPSSRQLHSHSKLCFIQEHLTRIASIYSLRVSAISSKPWNFPCTLKYVRNASLLYFVSSIQKVSQKRKSLLEFELKKLVWMYLVPMYLTVYECMQLSKKILKGIEEIKITPNTLT